MAYGNKFAEGEIDPGRDAYVAAKAARNAGRGRRDESEAADVVPDAAPDMTICGFGPKFHAYLKKSHGLAVRSVEPRGNAFRIVFRNAADINNSRLSTYEVSPVPARLDGEKDRKYTTRVEFYCAELALTLRRAGRELAPKNADNQEPTSSFTKTQRIEALCKAILG